MPDLDGDPKKSGKVRLPRWVRVVRGVVVAVLTPAALFYLFGVPALLASGTGEPTPTNLAFAGFMFLQFWVLTAEFAFASVASLYGFRRKSLFGFMHYGRIFFPDRGIPQTDLGAVLPCLLSYFFTVYGFGVAYTFISAIDKTAFSCGTLSLFDATYFSLITAATIGYGDIAPVSRISRGVVMAEVVTTFAYAVFLLSVLAGAARDRSQRVSSPSVRPRPVDPSEPPPSPPASGSQTPH
jgi:voltage-gated potassium channel